MALVAPLHNTIAGVIQAQQLADAGQFYQANQALKSVQDGVRLGVENLSATPKTAANTAQSATTKVAAVSAEKTGPSRPSEPTASLWEVCALAAVPPTGCSHRGPASVAPHSPRVGAHPSRWPFVAPIAPGPIGAIMAACPTRTR